MKKLENKKNFFACFVAVFLILPPAYAHECILEGNTAAEISRYNNCKADLNVASIHKESSSKATAIAVEQLKAENALLKAKLNQFRLQLLSILSDF